MILMIVFGLLVLFYGFVAYKCAANWHIAEVLLLFGVFLGASGFAVLAAMSLKTHQGWQEKHDDFQDKFEKVQHEVEILESGDLLGTGSSLVSLPEASGRLNRFLIDRGRVWRNVVLSNVDAGSFIVDMSQWGDARCIQSGVEEDAGGIVPLPDPVAAEEGEGAEAPRGPVRAHQIIKDSIVFAFLEFGLGGLNETQQKALLPDTDSPTLDLQGPCQVPVVFLGQFRVVEASDQSLQLQPIYRLDDAQMTALQAGQGQTWVLYDVLPKDSHDIFSGLDQEAMASILGTVPGMAPADQETLIGEYLRDGQVAERSDPPGRVQWQVEFTRTHTIAVDVEGDAPGIETSFDATGRAVLTHLRYGQPVEFAVGDVAWFDGQTARQLINDGVAKATVENGENGRYIRGLRGYEDLFLDQRRRLHKLAEQTQIVTAETQAMTESAAQVEERIEFRTKESSKLADDLSHFQAELQVINGYVQQLEAKVTQLRGDIRRTKRDNLRVVSTDRP